MKTVAHKTSNVIAAIVGVLLIFALCRPGPAHEGEDHGDVGAKSNPALMLTNEMCPVMTENKVDPEIYVEYAGKRIYLCCKKCKKDFLESPELYLVNLPQFTETERTAAKASAGEAESGHEHAHAVPNDADHAMAHEHGGEETRPHDHARDHGQSGSEGGIIRFAGKFHPMVVHFPIAMILTAAMAELLNMWLKKKSMENTAFSSLALGALSAFAAATLGWAAGAFARYPATLGAIRVLTIHRWLGTSTALVIAVAFVLAILRERKEEPDTRLTLAYRIALFLGAALVAGAGHFGAALIFGLDHFTN